MNVNPLKFPETSIVNKVVPKTAFYRYMEVNAKLKHHLIDDVEKIVWLYKLAPKTINVEDGQSVHEITVFDVELKGDDCSDELLEFIDKNMPRHIIFLIRRDDQCRLLVNYKEWIDEKKGTFSITKTFKTPWLDNNDVTLTVEGLTLDRVYDNFVAKISGLKPSNTQDLAKAVELKTQVEELTQRISQLQKRIKKEIQFNRKVELNNQRKALVNERNALEDQLKNL